ncbi:MAG: acetyl-CoA acetyltransferase [Pseudomonadota bacterium]
MIASEHIDPRQPVLVGIGTCMQREDDLTRGREPMDLMLEAVRRAGADAGSAQALAGVGCIALPKGRWRYRNPGGEIARAIGADSATTVLASVGVLQQSLIADACGRIAAGEIDSALVAGADTGYRILRARQAGQRAGERQQDDTPDISLEPDDTLLHPAEASAGIKMPVALYAILESAWRAKKGWTVDEHRRRLGTLYQRFSEVAAGNPDAWRRQPLSATDISDVSEHNPMQAFPYTRLHCATWNVDQAAALLLCSAGKAQALGIPRARWVYARASSESGHMTPVSARADLASCIGARLAGRAVLAAGGVDVSQLDLVDLYSCFPIAVASYAEELGLALERDLTVTGGMPFAGGPFNNYVLQATCRMAQLIREGRGRSGLVASVSGILTKQGFGLWSSAPGEGGYAFEDVTADTARLLATKEVTDAFHGRAVVAGYTVVHDKNQAPRALVLADTETGCRALAWSADPALVQRLETAEFCGAGIAMEGTVFTPA